MSRTCVSGNCCNEYVYCIECVDNAKKDIQKFKRRILCDLDEKEFAALYDSLTLLTHEIGPVALHELILNGEL